MTRRKEKLLSKMGGEEKGTLTRWRRVPCSMYFYVYCLEGFLDDRLVVTSPVIYFFVKGEREFAFTKSGSLYSLSDEHEAKSGFEFRKRMDMVELRARATRRI